MVIKALAREGQLRASLDALETSLATPIVSGEMAEWAEQVRGNWADVAPQIREQFSVRQQKQYAEMTTQDPELFPRVEKLEAEDAALEEQSRAYERLIARLANLAPLVEPDERKFHSLVAELQKHGIEFITRVRKQMVAVDTWYQEAFNRDRGVAD